MADPILARNAATRDYSATVPVSGEVVITLQTAGYDPFMFGMHVIQCNAAFTVEVLGPAGAYAPFPKVFTDSTTGAGSGEIFLASGRWDGIKVKAVAGTVVYWRADLAYDTFRR